VKNIPRLAAIVVPDLAITGIATETFALKVVGYGVGLALLGPVLWATAGAVGIHLSLEVPLLGVLLLGAAGAISPFFDLHKSAESRRRHFCHSLSTYASLVSMAMAGSMGWSSALEVAAGVSSTDWAMEEIAQTLLWAQAYRKPPSEGLERLAVRFNVPELADLAMAMAMAMAGDGARIRDTLDAKAASLRLKETSALEDAAQAVTQKMLLPGVLLMAGYGVLVFYPALAAFTGSHL
jgi:tight adherence protein C